MKNAFNKVFYNIKNRLVFIVLIIVTQSAISHEGHHTKHAWQACETKSIGEHCHYVMQTDQLYKGSCRQMTKALMCVRNHPILTLSTEEIKELAKEAEKTSREKNTTTAGI